MKKTISYVLVCAAFVSAVAKDYGRTNIVRSGPAYAYSAVEGNKSTVTLDAYGSELAVHDKYGYIEGFAVAGADRVFHWAKARSAGEGRAAVCSDAVDNPAAGLF